MNIVDAWKVGADLRPGETRACACVRDKSWNLAGHEKQADLHMSLNFCLIILSCMYICIDH
jgi:hypothetical protein